MRPSKRWRGSTRWSSTEMTVNATSAAGGSGQEARGHRVARLGQLAVALVAAGRGGRATVVGLDPVARAGPAAGVGRVGLEAGGDPGQVRRAEGGALRHRDDVDRQPGAVGQRLHPGARSARRRRWRRCGGHRAPPRSMMWRTANAEPSCGGPPDGRRAHPDVEVVQRGPAVRVVERHPLAPQVAAARPGPRRGRGPRRPVELIGVDVAEQPPDPVHEQAAGVRRAADRASCPAWCGARSRRRRPRPTRA